MSWWSNLLGGKAWMVGVGIGVVVAGVAVWRSMQPTDEDPPPRGRDDRRGDGSPTVRRRPSRRSAGGAGTTANDVAGQPGQAAMQGVVEQHGDEEEDSADDGVVAPPPADAARTHHDVHDVHIPRVVEDREPDVLLTTAVHANEGGISSLLDTSTAQVCARGRGGRV